jgi:DNA-binding response OmpR family regulator
MRRRRLRRGRCRHFPLASLEGGVAFRFADFEIDVAQQELRRSGEIVHMEPQVFDLLLHLVRNRGRIVSKDELIETVWNGRIVSEAASTSTARDELFFCNGPDFPDRFVGGLRAAGVPGP